MNNQNIFSFLHFHGWRRAGLWKAGNQKIKCNKCGFVGTVSKISHLEQVKYFRWALILGLVGIVFGIFK